MSNSDWELVDFKNQSPSISENASEWESYTPEEKIPKESILASLGLAIPRIASDIGTGLYQTAKKAPEYYEKGKSELRGLPSSLMQHPMHALGQAGAGLTELGHETLNLPRNIADYASSRLNLLPKNIAESVPYQKDISAEIAGLFGKPEYAGEELLRGTVRNAPQLMGGASLARTFNPMRLTDKNIIKDVMKEKGRMEKKYSGEKGLYTELFKEARSRGMGNVNATIKDIDILRQYTPEKKLLGLDKFIKSNTIENAQRAISDLGHIERSLEKKVSLNEAEQLHLSAAKSAKNEIQNNMFAQDLNGNLPPLMHGDLLSKHKNIQKGYAKENVPYTRNAAIKKYLNKEITEDQLINSLKKGSFAAKVGKRHLLNTKEKLLKLSGLGALGAIGTYGYNSLKDLLSNESKR